MRAFVALVRKEINRFMAIWVQALAGPLMTAILYQLIFGKQLAHTKFGVAGISYADFLIPGLIMMQTLLNAFSNASSSLIHSKYTGNIIFLLMAPITNYGLFFAYVCGGVARGILVGAIVYLGIIWFGDSLWPFSVWWELYFAFTGAIFMSSLGLIAGVLCNKFEQIGGFQSFIIVPLVYLSGVFFNVHGLSPIWRTVALCNPFLYLIDGFRYGFIGHIGHSLISTASLSAMFACLISVAAYGLICTGVRIRG